MSISQQTVSLIKEKVDIVEIISQYVKLSKKGINYFGKCPFHTEKTPSFCVNQQKQTFTCFGCGAYGDVIAFIEKYKNLDFIESVKYLSEITGINIPDDKENFNFTKYINIKNLNNYLVQYYRKSLLSDKGKIARTYLKERKVDERLWDIFSIGLCHDFENNLYLHLLGQGFTKETLSISGIFNKKLSVMLNRRIIFPIFNEKDECIGFGGRTLDKNNEAKYINSPETLVFKKKDILYNWNIAHKTRSPLIITEGYFDVISMYKIGYEATVAPLGTAISANQIKLAWRHSTDPIVAFDGDEAGTKAAFKLLERAIPLLSSQGKSFKFLKLPPGKDLDELANINQNKLVDLISSPTLMKDMLLEKYLSMNKLDTPENKAFLLKTIKDDMAQINELPLRNFYFDFLNDELFLKKGKHKTKIYAKNYKQNSDKISKYLFALILEHEEILENVFEKFANITYMEEVRNTILTLYTEGRKNILAILKEMGYKDALKSIFTPDVLLHTEIAQNYPTQKLVDEWNGTYFKEYVERHEKEKVSSELKTEFSNKKWELLKRLKGN